MLPLLALPFGAKVPSTPEVDAIDPEFRRMRIHQVVVDFLDATLTGPILLVVEDAHWIDDASGDLTNHLVFASSERPWAGIITRRPEGSWEIPEADHVVSLHLEPLDDEAIRQLAIEVSTRPLADRDLDLVATRAQGNPLFAVELAKALSDSATDGAELPDTIEQIIASRFDRLDPAARRLIRVASVLGNLFHEVIVSSLLSAVDRTADVGAALAAAEAAGAITPRPGSRWGFIHALYRDTAYEGLPFKQRQQLHRLAAEIIEERAADSQAVASLLSLHYSAARAHEPAWRYSLVAAEAAEAQNATSEAAIALERALASGRYCRSVAADARRPSRRATRRPLLRARSIRGCRTPVSARSTRWRRQRSRSWPTQEDRTGRRTQGATEARRSLVSSRRISRAATDDRGGLVDRAGSVTAGGSRCQLSRRRQRALSEAGGTRPRGRRRAGDENSTALALERIHLALVVLRQPDSEHTGERALELHLAHGDLTAAARVQTNLGIAAYFESRWVDASNWYLASIDSAQRSGRHRRPAANAAFNSAEILADQGQWIRAIELCDDALRNLEAVEYQPGTGAALLFSAVAAMRAGDVNMAASRLGRARTIFESLG